MYLSVSEVWKSGFYDTSKMLDLVRAKKISGGQNLTFSQRKQSFYFRVDFLFQNNQISAHSQNVRFLQLGFFVFEII